MPSLDEVGVRLKASGARETAREIRTVRDEIGGVARETRQVGSPEVGRGIGDLGGRFSALRGELGGVHSGLLSASSSLQTFTTRGILGLGALSATAIGFGLKSASGFEQSQIAFGTLLGSMQQGQGLFERLQQFNLQTPFELPDLTGATQQLLQYGFAGEEAFSTIKTVADVAATSGARAQENLDRITYALGQIRNQQTLRADDIRQLTDAGFPALNLLSEVSGLTGQEIRKNLESGLDPQIATDFLAAVETGQAQTFSRFRGGAAAQARTLSGIYSNFKDTIQVGLAGQTKPLADSLVANMPAFQAAVDGLITSAMPGLIRLTTTLAEGAPAAITAFTPVLGRLTTGFADLAEEVGPHMPEILDLMSDFLGLLPELVEIGTELLPVVGGMVDVFGDFLDLPFGHEAAGTLLVTLLGYRALAGVAGAVTTFAAALDVLTGAQARNAAVTGAGGVAGAGRGGKAGKAGKAARAGGGLLAVVPGVGLFAAGLDDPGLSGTAKLVGGGAVTGGGVGFTVAGPPGALIGAGVGAAGGAVTSIGQDIYRYSKRQPGVEGELAPGAAVPAPGLSAAPQVVQKTTTFGDINVFNPASNVDVVAAIKEYDEEKTRRD